MVLGLLGRRQKALKFSVLRMAGDAEMNMRYFSLYRTDGAGWVRLFGVGFRWKDLRKYNLSFSERNGHKRHLEVGRWSFAWLPRLEP